MNRFFFHAAVMLGLLATGAAPPAAAQASKLNQDLLKDWLDAKDLLMKLANEMPADKYTFKATPQERDFGQQVVHIATANVLNLAFLGSKTPAPVINRTATSKAEAMKTMAESFDYGAALIREQTDQSMLETVQSRTLGPSTRARVIYFLIGHCWDIYGQMVVYLRLNGGVPPASQRP
jgi:uncharacterized damage-inducible protein DinB